MIGRIVLIGFALTATFVSAYGGEERWGFCLSADFQSRQAFVSDAFTSGEGRPTLESWYLRALKTHGSDMPFVQCPMPSDRIEAARSLAKAESFLTELGFQVRRTGVNQKS